MLGLIRRYPPPMPEEEPLAPAAAKSRARAWVVAGLLGVSAVVSVTLAVRAIPSGSAAERTTEAARIQDEIFAAFASAGVASDDLEFWAIPEVCNQLLPDPWRGTHSVIRVKTEVAVEPTDVIAALGTETGNGGTWVEVESAIAEHTVAFGHGRERGVTVSSKTGCYAE